LTAKSGLSELKACIQVLQGQLDKDGLIPEEQMEDSPVRYKHTGYHTRLLYVYIVWACTHIHTQWESEKEILCHQIGIISLFFITFLSFTSHIH